MGHETRAATTPEATVLVADDEPAVRETMVVALRRAGYRTLPAADGDEAFALLEREQVDVALLDVDMPGRSGLDLVRAIRSDPRHEELNVLLITGDAALESKLEGFDAGAHDYLVKPVALAELLARVGAQLRDRSQWQARLEERLSARAQLARRLAEVDPSLALGALERELRDVLAAQLRLRRLTITPATARDAGTDEGLEVEPGDGGVWVRLPLRFGGSRVGTLAALIDDEVEVAVSTLGDLAPQLGAVVAEAVQRHGDLAGVDRWVERTIAADGLTAVFQPIVALDAGRVMGFEGLTRFADGTRPDVGFARAVEHGAGLALETAAIRRILRDAAALPPAAWLSVNVSGGTLLSADLPGLFNGLDRAVVLELTENERVVDYEEVRACLSVLPDATLAVDDAGAGYASLRHIFELRPGLIKLDRSWVSGLDDDPGRQALIGGLTGFARVVDAQIVAEGIERPEELLVLRELGVGLGQGYLMDRPAPASTELGTHARATVRRILDEAAAGWDPR